MQEAVQTVQGKRKKSQSMFTILEMEVVEQNEICNK